ncbi:MAG: D-alanyl-D-alanine carboxypeptidase/D-alanyl-D-alanine-endopeptidase (penicillin-binding protein 4) [Oceanospirillaceae bacterium]|jgi:D-alanyl-D-alanine carboxypeptidase/D-alanyl-D-alanine-endopeptidase (penicillin-binding protein 4)
MTMNNSLFCSKVQQVLLLVVMSLCVSSFSYGAAIDKHNKILQKIPKAALLLAQNSHIAGVSIRPQQLLVPASTLKVVTAYLAIKRWGLDHKFYTDFYYDDGTLWIKGFGDPYITSEEIALMTREIKKLKIGKIKNIKVDHSYFPELRLDGRGDSDNPYDAGNAALVVNFNTVFIEKRETAVLSAEAQTPITPLAKSLAAKIGFEKKRISLPGGRDMAAQYFGEVYAKLHFKRNLPVSIAKLSKSARFVYRHYNTRNLEDLLSAMLKYSNNFIANQLFLMLPPTSENQAELNVVAAQKNYTQLLEQEFSFQGASFVDGAGLSRLNQISAQQLLKVLEVFRPWIDLLPERRKGLKAKTGTLSDNHSLAGYFLDKQQQWQAFVLLINKRMPVNYRFQVAQALNN